MNEELLDRLPPELRAEVEAKLAERPGSVLTEVGLDVTPGGRAAVTRLAFHEPRAIPVLPEPPAEELWRFLGEYGQELPSGWREVLIRRALAATPALPVQPPPFGVVDSGSAPPPELRISGDPYAFELEEWTDEERQARQVLEVAAAEARAAAARRKEAERRSFVYLARCGEFMKIGVSVDPHKRLLTLVASCPYPVELVAVWAAPAAAVYGLERRLHEHFAALRHHHEWFRLAAEHIAEVHAMLGEPERFA